MRAPPSRPIAFQTGTLDVAALQAAGGAPLPEGGGISIDGWTVQSRKGPIMRDALVDDFKQQLGDVHNLPEQLFRDSFLRLTHVASGVSLQFDAQAALQEWGQAVLSPVQVKAAEAWQRAREQDLQGTPTLKYDWTYTTPYCGSVCVLHSAQHASSPSAAHDSAPAEAEWTELGHQMDKSLLMERDPILYFDDLPLYESELDDNGVSQLRVKVRVMPRCWYVLLRFWLRVDNVLVRMRDTRMMCTFGSRQPQVHRELKWSEGTFAELRRESAPATQMAYADADATAVALQAVEPVGIKLFRTEQLKLNCTAADLQNMDLS